MTTTVLSPLADTVREATVKRWRETEAGRREQLVDWQETRTQDGTLMLSARVDGPDPGGALHQFADRSLLPGDQLPALDVMVPGREACVWRTDGVWVELWRPDTASAVPEPVPAPQPVQAAPKPSPRSLLGGRLPFARTRRQETTA